MSTKVVEIKTLKVGKYIVAMGNMKIMRTRGS